MLTSAMLPNESEAEEITNNGEIGVGSDSLVENFSVRRSSRKFEPPQFLGGIVYI